MLASLARRTMSSAPVTASLKRTRALMLQLPVGADKRANLTHAQGELAAALAEARADLVVLPEVWQSPYGVQHFAKYAESFGGLWDTLQQRAGKETAPGRARWGIDGRNGGVPLGADCASETLRWLSEQARQHKVVLVGGSIPERDDATGKLYNTSSVFDEQGHLISLFRKVHLFDINVPGMSFQESATLSAGDRVCVFECSLGRFGLGICYDVRFGEYATICGRLGAGAILYPGAFNTTTGPVAWELLLRARAADNQLYVLGCSPARPSQADIDAGSYPTWGHSTGVDPWGKVLATCDAEPARVRVELDPEMVQKCRAGVPISTQRRFDLYADISQV